MQSARLAMLGTTAVAALGSLAGTARAQAPDINQIENVVVIFAENRAFDNLYGHFPGADGIDQATPENLTQKDRDGTALKELPPIWDGLTAKGVTPPVTQAETEHLPNGVFYVDDPKGFNLPLTTITHDLWHRYYQNIAQIDGGKNDMFVAWADSGAMPMGMWDYSQSELWKIAQKYTLADHWFMGGFGGSFFNHQWLICACAPHYDNADTSAAKPTIAKVDPDGVTLTIAENSPKSAMEGIPKYVSDGNLTPDFYAVNTMQPPYQPSANPPAEGGDPAYADPLAPNTLPPQTEPTIGDLLSLKDISWAWYGGAWQYTLDNGNNTPVPNFQYHHQPFNYYKNFAPGTAARAAHLRDGGLAGANFIQVIDDGKLPQVAFYKPQGNLNQHSGYADIQSGDAHIASVIDHLEKSPQWEHMLVVVTYDENGGIWDHVAPPKGDRWGPGTRIPALIISPFAKKGFVDKTVYDTTSILKLITKRFGLEPLAGVREKMGDLTNALDIK